MPTLFWGDQICSPMTDAFRCHYTNPTRVWTLPMTSSVMCVDVAVTDTARRRLSANSDDDGTRDHRTRYGYDRQLLTTGTRPDAVRALHAGVEPNPADLIARCDAFRSDGLPGAKIYSPCPTSARCWVDDEQDDSVERDDHVSTLYSARSFHCWIYKCGGRGGFILGHFLLFVPAVVITLIQRPVKGH